MRGVVEKREKFLEVAIEGFIDLICEVKALIEVTIGLFNRKSESSHVSTE